MATAEQQRQDGKKKTNRQKKNILGCGTLSAWRSKVLGSVAGVAGTSQQNAVRPGWASHCELVKCHAHSAGLLNAGAGARREPEGDNRQLRDFGDADVVRDGAHDDSNLVGLPVHVVRQATQANRWPVRAGHEQPLQDNLVEIGIRSASKESVQLDQELQVRIVGLRRVTMSLLAPATSDKIDTLQTNNGKNMKEERDRENIVTKESDDEPTKREKQYAWRS